VKVRIRTSGKPRKPPTPPKRKEKRVTLINESPAPVTDASQHMTVEEALLFLVPVTVMAYDARLPLLRQLGKDCSMVCRIRKEGWIDKPVHGRSWPTERAYSPAVLREVFANHPQTRDLLPKSTP
jgi:hypothetical protein